MKTQNQFRSPRAIVHHRRWIVSCSIVILMSVSYVHQYGESFYFLQNLMDGEKDLDSVEKRLLSLPQYPHYQEQRRLGSNENINPAIAAQIVHSLGESRNLASVATTTETSQEDYTYHSIHQRQQQRHLNVLPKAPLRCATFGNVDTYGSMAFQGGKRMDSYAYHICHEVDNYGVISQTANYPTVCLQSLIGDDKEYDVLIFDYDGKPNQHMGLASRLRERFPGAKFIVLDRFQPFKIVWKQQNKQITSLSLRRQLGSRGWRPGTAFNKRIFTRRMKVWKNERLSKGERMKHKFVYKNSKKTVVKMLESKYNALTLTFGNEAEVEDSMIETLDFYNDDGDFLTQAGHDLVANEIKAALQQANIQRTTVPVGTWGDGDSCHLWFNDGELKDVSHGLGVEILNYDKSMYALAFPPAGSWIRVNNPFPDNRDLYLSYAVSPGSTQLHSNVNVVVERAGIDIDLDTRGFNTFDKTQVVSPKIESIGKIPPGSHFVQITPYNDGTLPFYLVGLVMTDSRNKFKPHTYEFLQSYWRSETIYADT